MQREEELEGVQMSEGTLSTLSQMREERAQQDKQQLSQINTLLEHWSEQLVAKTRAIVQEIRPAEGVPAVLTDLASDMQGRGHTLLATVQEAHNRQLGVLKASISEERRQFAQAQLAFEQTLKTRYECMVDALHEKMRAEQEARMQRALDNLERSARIESERAKQSFEIQQEAELTLSQKFKSIVADLRRSWEEEETGRAMQLEERLRSHYR
ncbi:hypothetical protein B484DRAFT_389466 [Ochromonadaceae sp. CCMP2298]|nr:hypothetical protein B484DRAFT_389466 [Ochromonadaceae sp. CCMP2298]